MVAPTPARRANGETRVTHCAVTAKRLDPLRAKMQEHFDSGATRSATWRREQLARVDQMLRAHNDDLLAALKSDLGKGTDEASITELALVRMELDHCKGHLSEWMATRHLASPAIAAPVFSKVCPEPRGVCLIIAPSNYPVLIALGPLIGALAAGNPTVIKPSELCGAVGACLAEIVPKYFPEEVCAVIEGGVNPTCELTARAWALVFFTGSERVGKLIAAAAAPTLTPCVLELGGKAPVVVCEDAPALKTMARRLLWGKTVNGGQSCVAPDYVLCVGVAAGEERADARGPHPPSSSRGAEQTAALASELARLAEETFGPAGAQQQSPDFGRQASVGAAARLQELLREAEAARQASHAAPAAAHRGPHQRAPLGRHGLLRHVAARAVLAHGAALGPAEAASARRRAPSRGRCGGRRCGRLVHRRRRASRPSAAARRSATQRRASCRRRCWSTRRRRCACARRRSSAPWSSSAPRRARAEAPAPAHRRRRPRAPPAGHGPLHCAAAARPAQARAGGRVRYVVEGEGGGGAQPRGRRPRARAPVFCSQVESVDAAIAAIKAQPGTPLALYVFTRSRATAERVISACPSGGAVRNDFLIQFAGVVPFGGLGSSGYGAAHGEATFAAFTHATAGRTWACSPAAACPSEGLGLALRSRSSRIDPRPIGRLGRRRAPRPGPAANGAAPTGTGRHYRSVLHKPCVEALEFGGLRFAPYRKFGGVSGKLFYTLMQASPTVPPLPRSLLGRLMRAPGQQTLACVLTVLAVALPALLGAPWARRALATAMARSASALADAAMAVEATCAD